MRPDFTACLQHFVEKGKLVSEVIIGLPDFGAAKARALNCLRIFDIPCFSAPAPGRGRGRCLRCAGVPAVPGSTRSVCRPDLRGQPRVACGSGVARPRSKACGLAAERPAAGGAGRDRLGRPRFLHGIRSGLVAGGGGRRGPERQRAACGLAGRAGRGVLPQQRDPRGSLVGHRDGAAIAPYRRQLRAGCVRSRRRSRGGSVREQPLLSLPRPLSRVQHVQRLGGAGAAGRRLPDQSGVRPDSERADGASAAVRCTGAGAGLSRVGAGAGAQSADDTHTARLLADQGDAGRRRPGRRRSPP